MCQCFAVKTKAVVVEAKFIKQRLPCEPLPLCCMVKVPPEVIKNFLFGITQKRAVIRLQRDVV